MAIRNVRNFQRYIKKCATNPHWNRGRRVLKRALNGDTTEIDLDLELMSKGAGFEAQQEFSRAMRGSHYAARARAASKIIASTAIANAGLNRELVGVQLKELQGALSALALEYLHPKREIKVDSLMKIDRILGKDRTLRLLREFEAVKKLYDETELPEL